MLVLYRSLLAWKDRTASSEQKTGLSDVEPRHCVLVATPTSSWLVSDKI